MIKEAKNDLQRLEDKNFWSHLNTEKFEFLNHTVKPLMRTISGVDFKAMRFEKDIVEISFTALKGEKEKFEVLKESIREKISELPISVNIVANEEELIRQAQANNFWANITEDKYDLLIEKLSPLMKFIESLTKPLGPAKFDFHDLVSEKEYVEFGPEHEAISVAKYRELVEEKVTELASSNPILKKLLEGESITEEEADVLADELHNEHPNITLDLLRRVYNHRKARFIQFIKHILGIEILESFPETVSKSFDQFIQEHSNLSTRQLQFLDLLRNYIIDKGDLTKRNLIESPFTMVHPEGIRGIFSPKEIDEILELSNELIAA